MVDPRRRRRPRDGLGARDQHPADVRDRVRRRLGARRPRRRDRRLVREPRAGRRRQLAALLARRRDHRRDGVARRRGDRLAAARPDDATSRPRTCRRTTRTTRSSSRSCSSRSCSRCGRSASSGGRREHARRRPTASSASLALVLAVIAPLYPLDLLGRRAADADALPRHRRREPDLPLGVRRHGLARPGRRSSASPASCSATRRRTGTRRASTSAGTRGGASSSGSRIAVGVGAALRRAREPERRDLLPDDHADLLGDREPLLRPGDRRLRLRRHQRHPDAGRRSAASTRTRTGSTTSRSSSRSLVYALLRYVVADAVRADAPGRPRRPGAHGVARLQRRRSTARSRSAFAGVHRGDRRRALRLVERPHRPGVDRPRRDDRRARDRRHRRPLPARGRLGRRARSSSSSTTTRSASASSARASTR